MGVFVGGNFMTTFGATSLSVGWHHLVAIGNGGQTSFWVDGVAVGSVDANVASVVEVIGNHTGGLGRFSDKIDDFRIYSRTLGVSEVDELFGGGNGDFGAHPYSTNSPIFDNSPEILLPSNPIVHWTFDELNGFLIKPAKWIKGTKMAYAGLSSETDRASLIKYLNQNSDNPLPLP